MDFSVTQFFTPFDFRWLPFSVRLLYIFAVPRTLSWFFRHHQIYNILVLTDRKRPCVSLTVCACIEARLYICSYIVVEFFRMYVVHAAVLIHIAELQLTTHIMAACSRSETKFGDRFPKIHRLQHFDPCLPLHAHKMLAESGATFRIRLRLLTCCNGISHFP